MMKLLENKCKELRSSKLEDFDVEEYKQLRRNAQLYPIIDYQSKLK
jgi:hypothetical protein